MMPFNIKLLAACPTYDVDGNNNGNNIISNVCSEIPWLL